MTLRSSTIRRCGASWSWAAASAGTSIRQPHPFDELALDLTSGQWENWIPERQGLGPAVRQLQGTRLEERILGSGRCGGQLPAQRDHLPRPLAVQPVRARPGLPARLLLRPGQHLLLRSGRTGLEGPGPGQPSGEGGRDASVGLDVLRSAHEEAIALRRRQRPDRTRRSGHLDLRPGGQRVGRTRTRQAAAAACAVAAGVRPREQDRGPFRRRPARPTPERHVDLRRAAVEREEAGHRARSARRPCPGLALPRQESAAAGRIRV